MEAELTALETATAEAEWLRDLLMDLPVVEKPVPAILMHCDNQAVIYITRNPVFHERTKHIELDNHFAREKFLEGLITLSHISTRSQLADFLTKNVAGIRLQPLLRKIGLVEAPPRS